MAVSPTPTRVGRNAVIALVAVAALALAPGTAQAEEVFTPGAPGVGDPYFPLDGNGGYDVDHYGLQVAYDPRTDVLTGTATISALATQGLSSFNLDLDGLTVRSIKVDGRPATWTRAGDELTVTPRRGIPDGAAFTTVVQYDGVPKTLPDGSGFFHTDDGALALGQPHVADLWFPVNDHPIDKASYTIAITVPEGLEAVSNGVLASERTRKGLTTWTWDAVEPMASYLAMMAIGEYEVDAYSAGGLQYWDALDSDLVEPFAARTGAQYAWSQIADTTYKRLSRTISVPQDGAQLSFWINRETELNWDFAFVEARTAGQGDWTTLPDLNGHTSQATGSVCPFWFGLHPFLRHYQSQAPGGCAPSGSTGEWWGVSGASNGYEQWAVDLSDYAGSDVEVSISYASDDLFQFNGVVVDDIVVSTGEGSTSFEADGDVMDGWTVPGSPAGSAPNANDWIVATAADAPTPLGAIAQSSMDRQPEIIAFLADTFGPYPFSSAGGVVDDLNELGFALETQTRPVYSRYFFTDTFSGDAVFVHEIAHQWVGDHLAVEQWQHIWLNEGFATYAEWLWSDAEGLGTTQQIFDFYDSVFPAKDPIWGVVIGDPGPDLLFDFAVYFRGAMTLQALRLTVGDDDFFEILRQWVASQAGGHVTTDEFIALTKDVSAVPDAELDELFQTWLFTPEKPDIDALLESTSASADASSLELFRAPTTFTAPVDHRGAKH